MVIVYTTVLSPFGLYSIAFNGGRICYASFSDNLESAIIDMKAAMPDSVFEKKIYDGGVIFSWNYIVRKKVVFEDFFLTGTGFQKNVWLALLDIPSGMRVSYGHVAKKIGKPKAIRAVAGAIAANRIAILVPCHRIVRASGNIGEYRWGSKRKKLILDWEASHF
jgi:AraC family transcriptional regulator, regulatory protein of adaptative response / methylated-DNA-[protein]-cysteine methyltransferase